jgi:RND family efflux transporter MFP subunit
MVAGAFTFASMKKPPEEKVQVDKTPIVEVSKVTLASMLLEVSSHGVVQPKYETTLVAQVTGQIVELSDAFVRGGFVQQGQLLAKIDPSDYEAALIDAKAALASARAAFEKEKAQSKVAADEWKRIKDSSPTELSLRKPQLAQELARVQAAEAQVQRAKRNLERTEITAPYDAIIDSRTVGLGSFVTTGTPIGKISGTAVAEVRLPVADNELQFLKHHGVNAIVVLTGKYAGKTQRWQATIERSEGVIDSSSRMSYLVARVDDPYAQKSSHHPLRFGSYVNAAIAGKTIENAAVVPRHLIQNNHVALYNEDSTLRYVPISIVREQAGNVIINQGLSNGDQIIISALDYPVEGMKLALATDVTPNVEKRLAQSQTDATEIARTAQGE